jgi:heme exporter protein D
MNWTSLQEFFHMGGYGLYVWGSYGVTVILLIVEVMSLKKRSKLSRQSRQSSITQGN